MAQLAETNPGLPIKVAKLLQQLGHQATWDAFLEAQTTAILARDGTARSRGGAFLALLKKQEQAAKLRQALHLSQAIAVQFCYKRCCVIRVEEHAPRCNLLLRTLLSWLLTRLLGTLKHCLWCSLEGSRLCLLCCSNISQK